MRLDGIQMNDFLIGFSEEHINYNRSLGLSPSDVRFDEVNDGFYLVTVELIEYRDERSGRMFYAVAEHVLQDVTFKGEYTGRDMARMYEDVSHILSDRSAYEPDDVGRNIAVFTDAAEAKVFVRQNYEPLTKESWRKSLARMLIKHLPETEARHEVGVLAELTK